MPKRPRSSKPEPIGVQIKRRRVDDLQLSLRGAATKLDISASHLTDLESGKRAPSEELLVKISKVFGIDEAVLRAGWDKASEIVGEVANQDAVTAAKVPVFLREARDLTPEQWDRITDEARRLARDGRKK